MESEIVEKFIISKEDFEKYFGSRKIISQIELIEYYKCKKIPSDLSTICQPKINYCKI